MSRRPRRYAIELWPAIIWASILGSSGRHSFFLRFYNPFVFPEYLVVEIIYVLHGQIGVEVPCDRREETCHFRGWGRGGIHDRHAAFAGKMNHERCGEGEMHPEMTEPFKSLFSAIFFSDGIVPYRAAVFHFEALLRRPGQGGRNQGYVWVAEGIGVDETKVGDIELQRPPVRTEVRDKCR